MTVEHKFLDQFEIFGYYKKVLVKLFSRYCFQ